MFIKGYSLDLLDDTAYGAGCGLPPYAHQSELYHRWNDPDFDSFLIATRTGSGKTMAATVPIVSHHESAIYLYPTNALLEDQSLSISKLIGKMNRSCYIYDGYTPFDLSKYHDSDVIIIVASGDSLERMKKDLKKSTKGEVLQDILSHFDKPILLLTNPDTIFLLCSLRYKKSAALAGILQSFQSMVVDEFHLYAGMELANLLFILFYCRKLNIGKRLIFLSATPSEETKQILNDLFHPLIIDNSDSRLPIKKQVQVVHDLSFKITPSEDFVATCIEVIKTKRDEIDKMPLSSKDNPVPVVIIVNSVIQAIRLEDELLKIGYPISQIGSYRGLVNPVIRSVDQRRFVIGTSAIEVGIDFDCCILIFEAMDGSSFLQRLGRAGRHRFGEVFFIGSYRQKESLTILGETVSRTDFERWVKDSLAKLDDMAWFIKTKYGLWSAYTVVMQGMRKADTDRTIGDHEKMLIKTELEAIFDHYVNLLRIDEKSIRFIKHVLKANSAKKDRWEKISLETAGFRPGSFNVRVIVHREKEIDRPEGAQIETTLKRVLEQGIGLRVKHILGEDEKPLCFVESFGRRVEVIADMDILHEGLFIMPDNFSFKRKADVAMNCIGHMDLKGPAYCCALPYRLTDVDWRIETWETAEGKMVAFGGYALLLKAWAEKMQV